jgi:hypothetical protein
MLHIFVTYICTKLNLFTFEIFLKYEHLMLKYLVVSSIVVKKIKIQQFKHSKTFKKTQLHF